jgi:hypothetical protein
MDLRVLMGVELADGGDARVRFEPYALMLWIGGALLLAAGAVGMFE